MARDVPAYNELQFRLTPGPGDRYDVLAIAAGGATAHGVFALPFSPEALENFRLTVDPRTRTVRGSRSPHREKAKRFGTQLFDALVADPSVRAVYSTARHDAEQSARGLRITLFLTRAPELADVPWEFLYHRPDFLVQSVWTPVVRYLDLPESRRPLQVSPPLRILGMISHPLDDHLDELDVGREKANLEEALSGLIAAGQVELHWLPQATLRALQHEVAHGDDFHVFHYIGHGEYDESSGEGSLVLERPNGRPHEVSGERLGSLLCDRRTLRLAVLNACEAAKTAPHDPLSGVAANLIEHEVPAVVGMQFAITDDASIAFAEEFYATLAEGYPVDAAVTEARRAMAADDEIEWGTPVLFMRVADGRLFDLGHGATDAHPRARDARLSDAEPGTTELAPSPHHATPGGQGQEHHDGDSPSFDAVLDRAPGAPDAPARRRRFPRRRSSILTALMAVLLAGGVIVLTGVLGGNTRPESGNKAPPKFRIKSITVDHPGGVATADGDVWVTSYIDGTLTHISIDGELGPSRRVGQNTVGLAVVGGVIWVASDLERAIKRYNPFNPQHPPPPIQLGTHPRFLATGNSDVWAATWSPDQVVAVPRRDPKPLPKRISLPSRPTGIAWQKGAVWITTMDGALRRINPGNVESHTPPRLLDAGGVATGNDGSVWITQRRSGRLTQIDPRTLAPILGRTYRVGRNPGALAIQPGARAETVWVANEGDEFVSAIDAGAAGGHRTDVPIGAHPSSIAVDEAGNVWVGSKLSNRVTRLSVDRRRDTP